MSLATRCLTAAGFTLVEMVVSLAVMSVLIAAMGSAVLLATQAIPRPDNAAAQSAALQSAVQTLRADLQAAVEITQAQPGEVTLVVPDQDEDGRPEVIQYRWSGSPGDALLRQQNQESPAAILPQLQRFALDFSETGSVTEFPAATYRSGEIELSRLDSSAQPADFAIQAQAAVGFRLQAQLPSQAEQFWITRLSVRSTKDGPATGAFRLQQSLWSNSGPGTPRGEIDVAESSMDKSFDWAQIVLPEAVIWTAGQTVALTFTNQGSGAAGNLRWSELVTPASVYRRYNESDAWTVHTASGGMNHVVLGQCQWTGQPWRVTRTRFRAITLLLEASNSARAAHVEAIALYNSPEQIEQLRWTNFAASPELLDLDADAEQDFDVTGAAGLDQTGVSGGVWNVSGQLRATVSPSPGQAVTVNARLRDTSADGRGGGIDLTLNGTGDTFGEVRIELSQEVGWQRLTAQTRLPGGVHWTEPYLLDRRAADEWVDLELTADAVGRAVAIRCQGRLLDSVAWEPISGQRTSEVRLRSSAGAGLQCDSLRIAAAGAIGPVGSNGP